MPNISDEQFEEYLYESVTVDDSDVQAEYVRVSADMAYWGRRRAAAEEAYLMAKDRVKREEAAGWLRTRDRLYEAETNAAAVEERKVKLPAIAVIDKEAVLDAGYVAAQDELAKVAAARKEMASIVNAIDTKREMLISLGATLRKEMEREPVIKDPDDGAGDDW